MAKLMQRGDPRAASSGLTGRGSSWPVDAVSAELDGHCDECGSAYAAAASVMAGLCPECAHHLYGCPACEHQMVAGRCTKCGWDGSVSAYVASLKETPDAP